MDLHEMGLRSLTPEEAKVRVAEIDAMFEAATGWGSWMVSVANEREAIANKFGFEHKWQARCGGQPTD
jgi:TnpA family transposase